jgi:hypothetical protein
MPSNLEIIKLNDLRLSARLISEQLRQGIHSGIRVGVGSEFEQYRHYRPGDDLKRIDWKYFSRSGKYMVKESTTESNLHIRFILDLSGSMNYVENGFSRLDYAKNLLASLAYLGNFVFRDLESGQEFVQDGKSVQAEFNKKFKAYLDQLSQSFQQPNVQLLRISMQTPLSEVVRNVLNRKHLS